MSVDLTKPGFGPPTPHSRRTERRAGGCRTPQCARLGSQAGSDCWPLLVIWLSPHYPGVAGRAGLIRGKIARQTVQLWDASVTWISVPALFWWRAAVCRTAGRGSGGWHWRVNTRLSSALLGDNRWRGRTSVMQDWVMTRIIRPATFRENWRCTNVRTVSLQ